MDAELRSVLWRLCVGCWREVRLRYVLVVALKTGQRHAVPLPLSKGTLFVGQRHPTSATSVIKQTLSFHHFHALLSYLSNQHRVKNQVRHSTWTSTFRFWVHSLILEPQDSAWLKLHKTLLGLLPLMTRLDWPFISSLVGCYKCRRTELY